MKWTFRAIATVLLAAVGLILAIRVTLLVVKLLTGQPSQPTKSETTACPIEMKGHRWHAAIYNFVNRRLEAKVLSKFRPLIAGEASGRILEIGAGTGANFAYYPSASNVVAVEPDPFMLRRARKQADELGLEVEFRQALAEALPFDDRTFDTVVATLVFCTVTDPDRAFAEVKRVLKPDGTFRFIEHVRASDGLAVRAQNVLTPLWRRIGAGCHLNRPTVESIEAAGFEITELHQQPMPLTPLVIGVARLKA